MDEVLQRDQNHIVVLGAVTDDANQYIRMLRVDPVTGRLLISASGGGTVTSISQGTGILLTPNPITTTGSVALATSLQPIASLTGNALKFLRVNAGETAVEYATVAAGLTVGSTTITSGTTTRILYDNAGVLGEYTISGSGTVVAMQTAPTFLTSITVSAANIITDTTTGTKIGTATNQKLGFFNATPIVQPTGDIVTAMQNLGLGASLTVSAATTITTANEASDATCFPLFVTASGTQTLQPKNNTSFIFDSTNGQLGASSFIPSSSTVPSNGMYLPAANTLGWGINGSGEMQLTATALSPIADGGNSLGTTALGWQNLFGNTGFVFNIENSDWVATHTTGILTVGTGDLRVTNAGTNSASAVTVGGTQTLTNKTLTAAKIVSGGFLADANGNELIIFTTTASAVNEITFANAATGNNPGFTASGGDSNIGLDFTMKGTGVFSIRGNATQAGTLRLYEDTDDGTNYSSFKVGTQAGNIDYTLPTALGSAGYVLTDAAGNGVLSWAAAGGGSGWVIVSSGTLGSASATLFDVSGISTNYDMFRVRINCINVAGSSRDVWLRLNNDSGSNYVVESTNFSGSSATPSRETASKIRLNIGQTINVSTSFAYNIDIYKSTTGMPGSINIFGKINATTISFVQSADWNNTSAKISRIAITDEDGTGIFDTGSTYVIEGLVI